MAGGTWTTQDKARPGVYINFSSEGAVTGGSATAGVVSVALALPWGEPHRMLEISSPADIQDKLGYAAAAPEMLLVREALKRARTVLAYRLNEGTKAAATHNGLTATARYGGVRGNDILLAIQENAEQSGSFRVTTYVDGAEADTQVAAEIEDLQANRWVIFSGTGELVASAGVPLVGGADGTVASQAHDDYLAAAELLDLNTIALVSNNAALKTSYAGFAERVRDVEGKKIQVVISNAPDINYEGVIKVKNGVILADGTELSAEEATVWVAAATASAGASQSLTYQPYDGAVDAKPRYTNTQIEQALRAGEFLFVPRAGRAVVEQDINSFTDYTPAKGKLFSKNRVVRVFDEVANELRRIFEAYYIGKVSNNADGRGLFQSAIVTYLADLQNAGAIQNLDERQDVQVEQGQEADSIYVAVQLQPVDAVEKIYMKVRVS